ncbi:MAG: aminotransferase class IV [Hymenobacteraceae bacterium]|nr:aminotransferase class IV [Hymenobacteraceae bacterium]
MSESVASLTPPVALLHDHLVPVASLGLGPDNRGFRYNDGFFETIIFVDGQPRWWKHHADRIRRGAAVLHLTLPENFFERLHTWLGQLVAANGLSRGAARVRWQCWREGRGFYAPQSTAATWLATADRHELVVPGPPAGRALLAESVQTAPSALSFLKGPNASLYVLACIERDARGADELILLSPRGFVAEATSSALIWLQGNTLYTPDPEPTGAIAGVRLAALAAQATLAGWRVRPVTNRPNYLELADAVATVSVTGVRWLGAVENHQFKPNPVQQAFHALL